MHRRQYLPHSGSKISRREMVARNIELRERSEREAEQAALDRKRVIAEAERQMNAGVLGFLRRLWAALTTPIRLQH